MMSCIFQGCVSTDRHWHGGFPGGYDDPNDPLGMPILFTDEPAPGVRDYNGALLEATMTTTPGPRTPCIESDWPRSRTGYRAKSIGGRNWSAHRYAWTQAFGPIPEGMHVCHTCDNRSCVNPEHLWLGTNADNTADKVAKGRQARGPATRNPRPGESNGRHRLTEGDVRYIRSQRESGVSAVYLAWLFGLNETTVRRIIRRVDWAHVV